MVKRSSRTVRKNRRGGRRKTSRRTRRNNHRGGFSIKKSLGAPFRGIKRSFRRIKQNIIYNDEDKVQMVNKFNKLGEVECLEEYLGDKLFTKYNSIKKYEEEGGNFTPGRKIKFIEDYLSDQYTKKGVPDLTTRKKEELLRIFDKLKDVEDVEEKLGIFNEEYQILKGGIGDDIECKKAMFIKNLPENIMKKIEEEITRIYDRDDLAAVTSVQAHLRGRNTRKRLKEEEEKKKIKEERARECVSNSKLVEDLDGGYRCECVDGYKKLDVGETMTCVIKNKDDICQDKYKPQIEKLENEIKEETTKLEELINSAVSKEGENLDTIYQKVKSFITETKTNIESNFKVSIIENKKKELRDLLTTIAAECLKDGVTSGLAEKIASEEKLFEEFEQLEIQKLREDFKPLFNKLKEGKDEIRDLSIFVISSDDGNINKNEYTGIKSHNISSLEVKTKYITLENKAYIRSEDGEIVNKGMFNRGTYLPPGTIIETNSRKKTNEKGTLVQISSVKLNGQRATDTYNLWWVKLINSKNQTVLRLINEDVKDGELLAHKFSERTDADYELKAGDILIMPEPYLNTRHPTIKFKKMDPAYGDKYLVYLTGTKEDPIYIKSQLGGGDLKVFTDSYFVFTTYESAINSGIDAISLNRLPYKERVKYVISPKIRKPTIRDQLHIFKEDGSPKITDFSKPFLNNISLSKTQSDTRIVLILQEFLLKIIETLRKTNQLELGSGISGDMVYKMGQVGKTPIPEEMSERQGRRSKTIINTYSEFGSGRGKTETNRLNMDDPIFLYIDPAGSDPDWPYIYRKTSKAGDYVLTLDGGWVQEIYIYESKGAELKWYQNELERYFRNMLDKINELITKKIENRILYKEDSKDEKKKENIYELLGINEKGGIISDNIKGLFKPDKEGELKKESGLDKAENKLNTTFFYCGIIKNPVDIYALPPPCSGISKSNLSITDDIIYHEKVGSVRDGKKIPGSRSKEPDRYNDYKYVNLDCAPKLLVDSGKESQPRKQNIKENCGPPFDRIDGIKTMNEVTRGVGLKRTCIDVAKIIVDSESHKHLKREIETQKKQLVTILREGYSMDSTEIKVIKRHILELHWLIGFYDTQKAPGKHITRIQATPDNMYEVMGFYVDKYACLLNAYDSAENMTKDMKRDFDCKNYDPNFISELNRNEKLIQDFYPEKQETDEISNLKYKYFGLPNSKNSIYSQQYSTRDKRGFIRNIRYRTVKQSGEVGPWETLHDDMALSINDIEMGIAQNTTLKIIMGDVQDMLKSTGGKLLVAGAMMGLKKGFSMAITKVLKVLIAGPLGLIGGGGGMKMITNDKYHIKQKRTKRTKRRRKRKITKKCSMKSNIK